MEVDGRLLDECQELTADEKDLVRRVRINGEKQADVARHSGKTPGTISTQLKKASEKYAKWVETKNESKSTAALSKVDFDKEAFKLFNKRWGPNKVTEKLGNAERVDKLWIMYRQFVNDDYHMAIDKVGEAGWSIDKDSVHPLVEQIANIVAERDILRDEKKLILDLLKEKGLADKVEDTYCSAFDTVKIVVDSLFNIAKENITLRNRLDRIKQSGLGDKTTMPPP